MSLRVLLRDHSQRSIALVTDTHALVFRHTSLQTTQPLASKTTSLRCMVEFSALDTVDLAEYRSIRSQSAHGTLGLININKDIFLCVITAACHVANLRPSENVQRIVAVEFCKLNSLCLSLEVKPATFGDVLDIDDHRGSILNPVPNLF